MRDHLEKIKNLPKEAPKGIQFTKDEITAILEVNAAKLLNFS